VSEITGVEAEYLLKRKPGKTQRSRVRKARKTNRSKVKTLESQVWRLNSYLELNGSQIKHGGQRSGMTQSKVKNPGKTLRSKVKTSDSHVQVLTRVIDLEKRSMVAIIDDI
jgi:hypothetical protein